MHEAIRELYLDEYGDRHGDTMLLAHAVAAVLHASGETVPDNWACAPGPAIEGLTVSDLAAYGAYPYRELASALIDGELTTGDLRDAGDVLARFLDVSERAPEH